MSNQTLLEAVRRKRKYAGFFDWPDKRIKESAIVRLLSEGMEAKGEPGFVEVIPNEVDPPDCVGVTANGQHVGIEVTEFVDQELAERGQRLIGQHRDWTIPDVIDRIQTIIDTKDLKCARPTIFPRLILLIHTDELFLRGSAGEPVLEALAVRIFHKPVHIDEVVFMVSYDPDLQTYPWVRLNLA